MKKNLWKEFSVGLLIITGIILFLMLALKVGGLRNWTSYNKYKIPAKDVLGIVENSSVMIAGVDIGKINNISVDWDKAIISISINKDIVLTQGTKFRIRGKSLLGEKYLQIIPGDRNNKPLHTNELLDNWAEHETEIGDFMTKMEKEYIPTPEDARKLTSAMIYLLYDKKEDIGNLITWMTAITKELPPDKIGKLFKLIESDLYFIEHIKNDYNNLKTYGNELFQFLKELKSDYRTLKKSLKKYPNNEKQIIKLMNKTDKILNLTESLLENLNFQLHKFDNVDYETLKELMQDEGFKIRVFKRSSSEKESDLQLFRSYPKLITGGSSN